MLSGKHQALDRLQILQKADTDWPSTAPHEFDWQGKDQAGVPKISPRSNPLPRHKSASRDHVHDPDVMIEAANKSSLDSALAA